MVVGCFDSGHYLKFIASNEEVAKRELEKRIQEKWKNARKFAKTHPFNLEHSGRLSLGEYRKYWDDHYFEELDIIEK